MTRLLLVRHGQSEWNASSRLQGQADIELSARGRAQADALRLFIQSLDICRTISSDLKRAVETAERIGAPSITQMKGLREIDVGDWTGQSIPDLIIRDEAAYLGWRAGTHAPPKGESWEGFVARTSRVVLGELARAPAKNLLVVCHGGVIRALLQNFLELAPSRIIPVGPASVTALQVLPNLQARLEMFNYSVGHPDFAAPD